jgi:hypothetical protein
MNVSENSLPEYLDFFDSHLKLIILDFYLAHGYNNEFISKIKSEVLSKTSLFTQQENFFKDDNNELNKIKEKKENSDKVENNSKQKIIGYLNMIENIKNNSNYDTSSAINKKIVYIVYIDG